MDARTGGEVVVSDVVEDGDRLSARVRVGKLESEIRFNGSHGIAPGVAADALSVALLPIAMRRGMPLEVPGRISPRLSAGIESAQALLTQWWEDWERVEVVDGGGIASGPDQSPGGTALFFTGGVDSFYSLLAERERLDALVFVHGFDVPLGEGALREAVAAPIRETARDLGLELVEVETDLRGFSNPHCEWGAHAHGPALAAVAHLTSHRFHEFLVPASYAPPALHPWASHPYLDPLWSSEHMKLVHHGAVPRFQKIAAIADWDLALERLRPCYRSRDPEQLNCARCVKCLRTMSALRAAGALQRSATLPRGLSLRSVAVMPLGASATVADTRLIAAAATAAGERGLAAALQLAVRIGPRRAAVRRRRSEIVEWARRRRRRTRRRRERIARKARRRGRRIRQRTRRARRSARRAIAARIRARSAQ